jgi:ornithine cyclodeaminase/alanine dehydrogenase
MKEQPTLLLNETTVRELLTMKDYIEIVDNVYKGLNNGTITNPEKLSLDLGETGGYPYYDGFVNAMPAYIGWQDMAGLKWVGGFTGERKEAGLPFINGLIILIEPHIGTFVAAMDGTHITNVRTGAQTATALSYLVDKPSVTIGMYGAGVQARMNTLAIAEVFDISKLTVWNHRRVTAEGFAEDMKDVVKGEIHIVEDPKAAANEDVLVTATTAQEPIVKADWVSPGTIVFPLGSFQEIEDDLILKADNIVVDHAEQALHRGALKKLNREGQLNTSDITTTLGKLANNKAELTNLDEEITICIPIGMGSVDVAVAVEAYNRAVEQGYDTTFDFKA